MGHAQINLPDLIDVRWCTGFSKSWGLRASVFFPPFSCPFPHFFCARPNYRAAKKRKMLRTYEKIYIIISIYVIKLSFFLSPLLFFLSSRSVRHHSVVSDCTLCGPKIWLIVNIGNLFRTVETWLGDLAMCLILQ